MSNQHTGSEFWTQLLTTIWVCAKTGTPNPLVNQKKHHHPISAINTGILGHAPFQAKWFAPSTFTLYDRCTCVQPKSACPAQGEAGLRPTMKRRDYRSQLTWEASALDRTNLQVNTALPREASVACEVRGSRMCVVRHSTEIFYTDHRALWRCDLNTPQTIAELGAGKAWLSVAILVSQFVRYYKPKGLVTSMRHLNKKKGMEAWWPTVPVLSIPAVYQFDTFLSQDLRSVVSFAGDENQT